MLTKTYSCDICGEKKPAIEFYGLRFTNYVEFEFGPAACTDGKHICEQCLNQILAKAPQKTPDTK